MGISLHLAGEFRDAAFALFDGHGVTGHLCAQYCRAKLPRYMAKHIRAARALKYKLHVEVNHLEGVKLYDPDNWPFLNADEYKECCRKAYLECNAAMHHDSSVSTCSALHLLFTTPSHVLVSACCTT
jgi:serine/threonine protein phosphatase PrpC